MSSRVLRVSMVMGLIACGGGSSDRPDASVAQRTLEELVADYEAGVITRDEFRVAVSEIEDDGRPSAITADIDGTRLLKPRAEPYTVTRDIDVVDGAILVVEAGARLELDQGASLHVLGRLYAVGSQAQPIVIEAVEGERFGSVELANGPNQLVWTEIVRGTRSVLVTNPTNTRSLIESCRFDSWVDAAVRQDTGGWGAHVLRSRFGYMTPAPDVSGETIVSWEAGTIIIEQNEFNYRVGYRDVIDLQRCITDSWPLILGNRFDGGEDDAIDLDFCSVLVVGNEIKGFRPIDLGSQVGGVNGGGITGDGLTGPTRPVLINNVIDGCYHGIGFKDGATPIIVNNTIINSNIGVTLYQSTTGTAMPHGIMVNNVLWNNVGWLDATPHDIVLNGKWWPGYNQVDDVQGTLDATYNIMATDAVPPPGEGNSSGDPLLQIVDGAPVPQAGSPALDSGLAAISFTGVPMERVIQYLRTDFRGQPRTESSGSFPGIDRGAVEASP